MGLATLTAVFAVVIVITLSSLRGLAMRENESHVQALLEALGSSLTSEVLAAPPANLRALTEADKSLTSELSDTRWSGDLLFRHGYFVELLAPAGADTPRPTLVAWPSQHGRTGNRAFIWRPEDGLAVRTNAKRPWSGLEHPPSALQLQ
jgi:hypothetical protein